MKNICVSFYNSIILHLSLTLTGLFLVILNTAAFAQDKTTEIDKIFNFATNSSPGCVCAVSEKGQLIFNKSYGLADLERNVPLSENSILDAGSVVKQFVAAATLLLVEEGKLALSDDVHKYIPELPDYGHKITIDHLLTHTSGLRDWTVLKMLSKNDEDALTLILRQKSLNFTPGEEWSYSNSGYVLLKEIVARISGMTFAEFTKKNIFDPLELNYTTYHLDMRDIIKNRALAFEKDKAGNWKMELLLDNDRGGGGALFSTPLDLLKWNEAISNEKLGKFISEKLKEPAQLNNGRKLGYARGLFLDSNYAGNLIWHSGGAAGYQTVLNYNPENDIAIAIMCNAGDLPQVGFAARILRILVPETEEVKSNIKKGSAIISAAELEQKTGKYLNEKTGEIIELINRNNFLQITGGPALLAAGKGKFYVEESSLRFRSGDKFKIEFKSQDKFLLRSMEGETTEFKRISDYEPTTSELNSLTGRYINDELGSVMVIKPAKNGIQLCLNDDPGKCIPFKAIQPDNFQIGKMSLSILRDNTGKITAFYYSNPLIRNIKYSLMEQ